MDYSRSVLDHLMGPDRNKVKGQQTKMKHYSDQDVYQFYQVCKPFLICFCFNELFPNTPFDEEICNNRHDPFYKNQFNNDPKRIEYQKKYVQDCIVKIQNKLVEVDKRVKKNQSMVDMKNQCEKPREIKQKQIQIDNEIEKLEKEAENYGEQGNIADSEKAINKIEYLRNQKLQIEKDFNQIYNQNKQQKICQICGAIQTVNDTDKRIQIHLEGKIHQGFMKLRFELERLRQRKQFLYGIQAHQKGRQENKQRRSKSSQKSPKRHKSNQKRKRRSRSRQKHSKRH